MLRPRHDDLPAYKKTMLQVAVYKRIRAVVNRVLGSFNLNATQWMILGVLYESTTGLKISDIAQSLEVEMPLITRLSQNLRADGLVRRELNVNDRRLRPLALTEYGKQIVTTVELEMDIQMHLFENNIDDQTALSYFHILEDLARSPKPKTG